jgi:hypothetical protein
LLSRWRSATWSGHNGEAPTFLFAWPLSLSFGDIPPSHPRLCRSTLHRSSPDRHRHIASPQHAWAPASPLPRPNRAINVSSLLRPAAAGPLQFPWATPVKGIALGRCFLTRSLTRVIVWPVSRPMRHHCSRRGSVRCCLVLAGDGHWAIPRAGPGQDLGDLVALVLGYLVPH